MERFNDEMEAVPHRDSSSASDYSVALIAPANTPVSCTDHSVDLEMTDVSTQYFVNEGNTSGPNRSEISVASINPFSARTECSVLETFDA